MDQGINDEDEVLRACTVFFIINLICLINMIPSVPALADSTPGLNVTGALIMASVSPGQSDQYRHGQQSGCYEFTGRSGRMGQTLDGSTIPLSAQNESGSQSAAPSPVSIKAPCNWRPASQDIHVTINVPAGTAPEKFMRWSISIKR